MNNGISASVDVFFLTFEIFIVLFITFILGFILGWIFSPKTKMNNKTNKNISINDTTKTADDPLKEVGAAQIPFDKILGLEEKHAEILVKEGITNYDELAKLNTKKLDHILPDVLKKNSFYRTWPNQAKFAAEEKWTDLYHYQAILNRTNKKDKSSKNNINITKKK